MMFIFCKICGSQSWAYISPFSTIYECPECGFVDADGIRLTKNDLYKIFKDLSVVMPKNIPSRPRDIG